MDYKRLRDMARFESKINKTADCWKWKGSHFSNGYAQFFMMVDGVEKNRKASRVAYEFFNGPIGDSQVLHRCNNRWCVNPDHLYLSNHTQNMKDRDVADRTSRWNKRYNFIQTPELEEKVKAMRMSGERIEDICAKLGIGRTTYYRLRSRGVIPADREIAKQNYRKAAKVR